MKIYTLFLLLFLITGSINPQWTVVSDNTMYLAVQAFADNGNNLYAAISGLGIFKSSNNGTNWFSTGSNLTTQPFNGIAAKDSFIFVASDYGLFRSTNYGLTFDSLTSHPGTAFSVIIVNNYLFKGTVYGIHRSTDWGNSWTIINNGINVPTPDGRSLASYNNIIYAGVGLYNLHIYKSTDYGDNWVYISPDIPLNAIPYSLYAYDNLLLCGTANGVYKTTNYGTSWGLIPGINGNIGLFGLTSIGTRDIFISAWNYGVYVSNDYGETFINRSEGLGSYRCTALYKYGDFLFLATNPTTLPCKVYRRPVSEVIGVNYISTEIPNEFKLFQNYPNPFNPSTTIEYQISKLGLVTIKLYDINGREVETVVNEVKRAGNYTVKFNASLLSSGIYFYKIIAGSFIQTKKMVLIK